MNHGGHKEHKGTWRKYNRTLFYTSFFLKKTSFSVCLHVLRVLRGSISLWLNFNAQLINMYTNPINGYYGEFGGAYIPEMLYANVEELRSSYLNIIEQPHFKKKFKQLLRDYVGRPTPLYFAERLSKHYDTNIYLKR